MKFYLSSYQVGCATQQLRKMVGSRSLAFVANAMDSIGADAARVREGIAFDCRQLEGAGVRVELLDLRDFFGRPDKLNERLSELGGLWVRGGNVFVLRQAMRLSGLDTILLENLSRRDFFYGGYSAGCCVLAPNLSAYSIVDDADNHPYLEFSQTIWDGLGVLSFAFMPHFRSPHPESAAVEKEIARCCAVAAPYRPLRDGEVLTGEIERPPAGAEVFVFHSPFEE